jgi:uncharacterized phage protein gp47/JayE
MPATGVTPAGYVTIPLATRIAQMQADVLATVDPQFDLSPATPDGQILAIVANTAASIDELGQVIYNGYNRDDVEGAGLDNLGDITGTPREGASFTQVYATLCLAAGIYAASTWDTTTGSLVSGTLVANIAGQGQLQFANVAELVPVNLAGTVDVVQGSANVTFASPQTLAAGSSIVFASDPTTVYFLSSAMAASTAGLLTVPYSGTTAGATTATPAAIALMQSVTIGPTPTVNDGTLTVITTPVSGWISVDNPPLGTTPNSSQAQAGGAEETDSAYALRQAQDVAGDGGCTASACAAALNELGAAQVPPIALIATVLENTTNAFQNVDGLTLPPHSYAPVIWASGSTWPFLAGQPLIAKVIYANKPAAITSYGETSVVVADPYLGNQNVGYTVPAGNPLYISAVVVPRPGFDFADLTSSIQAALVAAAVAPTPPGGVPPVGQLAPGNPVIGAQIAAVIMSVPGVLDIKRVGLVQLLTFDFIPSPTNQDPLIVLASQIATIGAATAAVNIVILPGAFP